MNPFYLAWNELIYRWRTSLILLGLVAVITGLISFFTINRSGFSREIRRNVRDIGSNVVILPIEVDQLEYHANGGYAEQTMPESVVNQLIEHRASLNHLIPMLEVKTPVSSQGRSVSVRVVGIAASIPMPGRPKAPMQKAVKENTVQLGSDVAARLGIDRDQTQAAIEIQGKRFAVSRVNRASNTWQDSAVFMNLEDAQQLFEKPGQISRIEAIECTSEKCAELGLTSTVVLENELARIDDRAQILRRQKIADARSTIRNLSAENLQLLTNALWLVLVVAIFLATVWNVLQRQSEVGLFRAIGYDRTRILMIFEIRTLVLALSGSLLGILIGSTVSLVRARQLFQQTGNKISPEWNEQFWILVVAVAISLLATAIPSSLAATKQPADIIGKDPA